MTAVTGEPDPDPAIPIHDVSAVDGGSLLVTIGALLRCTMCGHGSSRFEVDLSATASWPAPRPRAPGTTDHDPGE
jgi:hypothetical protein